MEAKKVSCQQWASESADWSFNSAWQNFFSMYKHGYNTPLKIFTLENELSTELGLALTYFVGPISWTRHKVELIFVRHDATTAFHTITNELIFLKRLRIEWLRGFAYSYIKKRDQVIFLRLSSELNIWVLIVEEIWEESGRA